MSLSPENRPANRGSHYDYQSASAASTQRIIDEGLKTPAPSASFTSAKPSPTPSVRHANFVYGGADPGRGRGSESKSESKSEGSYKQALADAERGEEPFRPVLKVRKQSWSEQDFKREMQEKVLVVEGERAQGFSEE